jgi:hypothetical protein
MPVADGIELVFDDNDVADNPRPAARFAGDS